MDKDWSAYAYQFEETGSHKVSISLEVNWMGTDFYSNLLIDSIRVVSGDEAEKALENNTKYPVGEKIQVQLLNENVKEAFLFYESDPDMKEQIYFCSDPTLRVMVTLDATVNPENAFLESTSGIFYPLTEYVEEDSYVVEVPNCKSEDLLGSTWLYFDSNYHAGITNFLSEEHALNFNEYLMEHDAEPVMWEYSDEAWIRRQRNKTPI